MGKGQIGTRQPFNTGKFDFYNSTGKFDFYNSTGKFDFYNSTGKFDSGYTTTSM